MRVCMISPELPPDRSGVADYVGFLCRHLAERDVEVDVIASRRHSIPETAIDGVSVLPLIDDWGWSALPQLAGIVKSRCFDVVHIQYQNVMYQRSASICALPAVLHLVQPRLRTIVTVHDYGTPWLRRLPVRAIAGPYGKAWFAAMLLASRRIIVTNEQDAWRFQQQLPRYPISARRVMTIPVGSNLPVVERQQQLTPPQSITVGYFGFANSAKGIETLLDAFARARSCRPDLRLMMICSLDDANPYQRPILQSLRHDSMRGAITVTGDLDAESASAALVACDIVALPFRDGVSLRRTTLVAALSLGCAVISTRSRVPATGLHEGEDVVLVPPSDPDALAAAILELAGDPDQRRVLQDNARRAAEAFSWPAIAERTLAIYESVLPRSASTSA